MSPVLRLISMHLGLLKSSSPLWLVPAKSVLLLNGAPIRKCLLVSFQQYLVSLNNFSEINVTRKNEFSLAPIQPKLASVDSDSQKHHGPLAVLCSCEIESRFHQASQAASFLGADNKNDNRVLSLSQSNKGVGSFLNDQMSVQLREKFKGAMGQIFFHSLVHAFVSQVIFRKTLNSTSIGTYGPQFPLLLLLKICVLRQKQESIHSSDSSIVLQEISKVLAIAYGWLVQP